MVFFLTKIRAILMERPSEKQFYFSAHRFRLHRIVVSDGLNLSAAAF
ncbi:hypothetical protein HMPREF9123_0703 [Neisseria bacilliformis ATCC BAA-1200]|uniref:Uncharacterized protein n=1 Tax=Neisseria bacilliformis ATCC BAA-1200 TaxID=888742 RepID=F2BAK0_9NEIS|nr:hypothetical protein HMPREF9123_0703 [Neisseria bacilliformis ATCC BAA-1200]